MARRPGSAARLLPARWIASGLALLALALRLHQISFQSLWWDEGISLYLAGLDLPSLTSQKDFRVDLHPPLYHVVLWAWSIAVGSSTFAARYLSALFGVVAVPLTYSLGRRCFGPGVGLLAALLLAISPFHVYHSQEARMYSLVLLLGLLSTTLAVRLFDRLPLGLRRAELAALAAVNAVGLYTYYYLGMVALAESVAFLFVWRRQRRSGEVDARLGRDLMGAWLVAQAATALAYLPWVFPLAGLFASGVALGVPPEMVAFRSLPGFLRENLLALSVGFSRPEPWSTLASAATVLLGLAALAPRGPSGRWLLALGVGLPLLGAYLFMLLRPFYYPRFVIFVAPLVYVLVAAGALRLAAIPPAPGRLARRLAPLAAAGALAALLVGAGRSLAGHYADPRVGYSSADYRVVLATLAERSRPGDALVGAYAWQVGYVAGYLPRAGLTSLYSPPASDGSRGDEARLLLARYARVWLLLYAADGHWEEDVLERDLGLAGASSFADQYGDSRVRLFERTPPAPVANPAARLGEQVALVEHSLAPLGDHRPGDSLDVTLVWQALAPAPQSYTVFTHLLGPDSKVRGQVDSLPLRGVRPTNLWQPGEVLVDRYRLRLDADAPPGEYLVEAGLYLLATGQRLPVGRSPDEVDRVILGRFRVVR